MKKDYNKRQIPFRPDPKIGRLVTRAAAAAGVSVNRFLERLVEDHHKDVIRSFDKERVKVREEFQLG